MRHEFYTRQGNRWSLEDFEDHKDFFDLAYGFYFDFGGIIPKNVMIRVDDVVFVISQTMIVLEKRTEKNRVLYLLREKGDTQI